MLFLTKRFIMNILFILFNNLNFTFVNATYMRQKLTLGNVVIKQFVVLKVFHL